MVALIIMAVAIGAFFGILTGIANHLIGQAFERSNRRWYETQMKNRK